MSGNTSETFPRPSPLKMAREVAMSETRGIGAILRSDCERFRVAPSLRRTLSADMSSEKWLSQQQSSSSIKKIASSAEMSDSVTDSSSEDETFDGKRIESDIWQEIQVMKAKEANKHRQSGIWSSILSQKVDDGSKSLPPYIHPLAKTSSSSLNGKSLEICTESLGSETGSDGFSSYPASETGDIEDEKRESTEKEGHSFSGEEWRPLKYNYREPLSRSFPPPLSSLSHLDGDSIRMQSRRINGRLVLEAVSVQSQNNFQAKRQDGRLVLSFISSDEFLREPENGNEDGEEEEELEETFVDSEVYDEEAEEEEDEEEIDINTNRVDEIETVTEQPPKFSTGLLSIHRLARSMNKSTGFSNLNGVWSNKADETAEQRWINPVAQSLPPRTQIARRVLVNEYEYPWRSNPTGLDQGKEFWSMKQQSAPMKAAGGGSERRKEEEEKVVVSFSNGCKQQPKRSPQFWESHCIATS